ncbi:MAG TPA: glycoside hydrolase family 38 C-terminal domain-containing protein [Clostridia bacterium]|nr:glycoside hydrolase family 38 C-terminal domain-containing protein [Clostridia bacterium]
MIGKLYDLSNNEKRGYWVDRIISQLKYASKVSEFNNNIFDELISNVEGFVYSQYESDGAILKDTVLQAENMMKDMSEKAKSYKMICAAHAHIDMNWKWRWDETVTITLDTFRTMLNIMNEYPDYKFSQSQASVYEIVEEYDPEMLEEIKMRVKEGRWEVTASTWVETDKNMPSGESLSRHILYAKKYLSKLFDLNPDSLNIDFEPDTFGHNQNVPEILSKGGVEFYYHCRGKMGENIYKWKAPSGASIIVYREPIWYNASIESSMVSYVPEFCSKYNINTMLKVYGVGDHGGGPTRRDIERIIDMSTWPIFPQIQFGTFKDFFSFIKDNSDKLNEVTGEQNFIFDGCYTTQTRIKEGNRVCERMLNEAEIFNSIASSALGIKYPSLDFEGGWKKVLFNHFHDIITGSGIIDTREYAMGLYQQVMATANTKKSIALRKIADNIDTSKVPLEFDNDKESVSEGAGVGFGINNYVSSQCSRSTGKSRLLHFFNPSAYERVDVVEVIIWDWTGDIDRIIFKDNDGVKVDHQIVYKDSDGGSKRYWWHTFITVLLQVKVPACGYTTYSISEEEEAKISTLFFADFIEHKPKKYIIENDLLKVSFNSQNASITSLIDKKTGEELIDNTRASGVLRLIDEDDQAGMTAWIVGRYMAVENLNINNVKIRNITGPKGIRSIIEYDIIFRSSSLKVSVWLDKGSALLKYNVVCDWREIGFKGKDVPQLGFYMPLNYNCINYKYDIPFGVVSREGLEMDVPANSFAYGSREDNSKNSIMLVTTSKHGFRCINNDISLTLIRSSYDPDPYPEYGIHKINFAIGVINTQENNDLIKLSYDYNHPISIVSGSKHEGVEPLQKEFISLKQGSIAISAIKILEKKTTKHLLIRSYETDGQKTKAVFKLFKEPSVAYFVDINENKIDIDHAEIKIEGKQLTFDALPFSIVNVVVEFEN